jgi:hypothetical protein
MILITTLVDITKTNIQRNIKPHGSILTQAEWDILRNKERNFQTVIQLLGLRFQPMEIKNPICYPHQKAINYSFGKHYDNFSVWKMTCDFDYDINLDILLYDFNNIPIISGLGETIKFDKACFITSGDFCNLTITKN